MANFIGGTPGAPRSDDSISGTSGDDVIFGDRFTTGNSWGAPEVGGVLSSGQAGDDRLYGKDGDDVIVGDAAFISGSGRGGDDTCYGGNGNDFLIGDADLSMSENARGGNDTL